MIIGYTIDELIDDIKLISSTPSSQNLFSKEKFIRLANNQLFSKLLPFIMSFRSDYFLTQDEIPISSIVDNKIKIPVNAVGLKLKDITVKEKKVIIPYIQYEEVKRINPVGYYILGNNICFNRLETISSQDTLVISYYRRPNYLVSSTECGKVKSVIPATNQLVLESFPIYNVGTEVCCVSATAGFDLKIISTPLLAVNGYTIDIEDVSGINVGDWIAPSNCSPIPQVPVETFPLFEQMIVIKIMETMNDRQGLENAKVDFDVMKKETEKVLYPRVDSSLKTVILPIDRGF